MYQKSRWFIIEGSFVESLLVLVDLSLLHHTFFLGSTPALVRLLMRPAACIDHY